MNIGIIILIAIGYIFMGIITVFLFMLWERITEGRITENDAEVVLPTVFLWPLFLSVGIAFLFAELISNKLPDLVDLLGGAIDEWKEKRGKE